MPYGTVARRGAYGSSAAIAYQLARDYGPAVYRFAKRAYQYAQNRSASSNPRGRFGYGAKRRTAAGGGAPSGALYGGAGGQVVRPHTMRRRKKFRKGRRFSRRGRRTGRKSLFKKMTPKQEYIENEVAKVTSAPGQIGQGYLVTVLDTSESSVVLQQVLSQIAVLTNSAAPASQNLVSFYLDSVNLFTRISSASLVTTTVTLRYWMCIDDGASLPLTIWGSDLVDYHATSGVGQSMSTVEVGMPLFVPMGQLKRKWKLLSTKKVELGSGQVTKVGFRHRYNKFLATKTLDSNTYLKGYTIVVTCSISGFPVEDDTTPGNIALSATQIEAVTTQKLGYRFLVTNRPNAFYFNDQSGMAAANEKFFNQFTTSKVVGTPV